MYASRTNPYRRRVRSRERVEEEREEKEESRASGAELTTRTWHQPHSTQLVPRR